MKKKFSEMIMPKIRERIKCDGYEDIIIYNIDKENKDEISRILRKNTTDDGITELDGIIILTQLLPILTNIPFNFDMNKEEDKQMVLGITENPSPELTTVIRKITLLLKEYAKDRIEDKKLLDELDLQKKTIEATVINDTLENNTKENNIFKQSDFEQLNINDLLLNKKIDGKPNLNEAKIIPLDVLNNKNDIDTKDENEKEDDEVLKISAKELKRLQLLAELAKLDN